MNRDYLHGFIPFRWIRKGYKHMKNIDDNVKHCVSALTPRTLAARLSIGRDKAYALMKSSGFPSIRIGDRFIVTEDALERWLRNCEGKQYNIESGRIKDV